ncbi:MAG: hypothetical protein COY22_01525 [Candidatus Tagabacteria bacterium CG_4_10_14_0_2_um_filter_40_13]|nr:MAG: hypothetical protein COV90_01660 [Candidatus Tagabacteria bacterium CG11_big_fil_rev_8_21_14_0_20_41_11]PIZ56384.1 MAG: hypothetical protein COY22_01525 [Candidatus Tagabacteria bacterium CG_4_10_14_0_2_um_filter_40_13]PJC69849.1 MAG: hypothetical protein CO014_01425 [Candidatus Tagabacteria bacterium CG_4_8_14_3_um_filter_41_8]
MFAKYAFPPNVLQFCGPVEIGSIFESFKGDKKAREIKNLLLQFSGAVPYLQLIAGSNGIKDIFDERVVGAYWLGNNLLGNVEVKDVYRHIEGRFKKNINKKDWHWLISGSMPEAKPFHGFHVFDIYRRAGLLRSGDKNNILETMDKCRIGWGKVESVDLNNRSKKNLSFGIALVSYSPLEFFEKKIRFGGETIRKFFLVDESIKKGDEVSFHWDYVCDRITPIQKKNLIYWTNYHLNLANQTI